MIACVALLALSLVGFPAQAQSDRSIQELAAEEAKLRREIEALRLLRRLELSRDQSLVLLSCAEEAVRSQRDLARERQLRQQEEIRTLEAFRREDLANRGFSKQTEATMRAFSHRIVKENKRLSDRLAYFERAFLSCLHEKQRSLLWKPGPDEAKDRVDPSRRSMARLEATLRDAARDDDRRRFMRALGEAFQSALGLERPPPSMQFVDEVAELYAGYRRSPGLSRAKARQRIRDLLQRASAFSRARTELMDSGRELYGSVEGPVLRLFFDPWFLPTLRAWCRARPRGKASSKKIARRGGS
ncbi:MAG: hypothetical protein ACE5F1_15075 [Planctomycetota bacterium]